MFRAAVLAAIVTTIAALPVQVALSSVDLVTFDGAKGTTYHFTELNDPVMGGQSTGTFHTDEDKHIGVFNGTCAIVPKLKAPGFIKASTGGARTDVMCVVDGWALGGWAALVRMGGAWTDGRVVGRGRADSDG